jgi:hypothetical protein
MELRRNERICPISPLLRQAGESLGLFNSLCSWQDMFPELERLRMKRRWMFLLTAFVVAVLE